MEARPRRLQNWPATPSWSQAGESLQPYLWCVWAIRGGCCPSKLAKNQRLREIDWTTFGNQCLGKSSIFQQWAIVASPLRTAVRWGML